MTTKTVPAKTEMLLMHHLPVLVARLQVQAVRDAAYIVDRNDLKYNQFKVALNNLELAAQANLATAFENQARFGVTEQFTQYYQLTAAQRTYLDDQADKAKKKSFDVRNKLFGFSLFNPRKYPDSSEPIEKAVHMAAQSIASSKEGIQLLSFARESQEEGYGYGCVNRDNRNTEADFNICTDFIWDRIQYSWSTLLMFGLLAPQDVREQVARDAAAWYLDSGKSRDSGIITGIMQYHQHGLKLPNTTLVSEEEEFRSAIRNAIPKVK